MTVFSESLRAALYASAIEANIMPPKGLYRFPYVTPAPAYRFAGCQWVWDIPYSGWIVASYGRRPDLTKGFLRNTLGFQDTQGPDAGMIPLAPFSDGTRHADGISQSPMLCWLSHQVHLIEPDRAFLEEVYPVLSRWIRWFRSERRDRDGDGLSEYGGPNPTFVAYEGLDFGPYQDWLMKEPAPVYDDGVVHDPVASVMLNSCLYMECRSLAHIAAEVAPGDESGWNDEAELIRERMNEAMWDEQAGAFFNCFRADLVASRPRHYRVTPDLLFPMWAGLATAEQAARTVELITGVPDDYPFEAAMDIHLGGTDQYYHGYHIVTRGLSPAAGQGAGAGGVRAAPDVRMEADGWRSSGQLFESLWPEDRNVAHTWFAKLKFDVEGSGAGSVWVEVADGAGRTVRVVEESSSEGSWRLDGREKPGPGSGFAAFHGLSRIAVGTSDEAAVSRVKVSYARVLRQGLLSPYGVCSAHPLDGKFPAPGAPTQFWSGTIWGPQVWHACHALNNYGYRALAEETARAFCEANVRAFVAGGASFEHLSPVDGTGISARDYTWGGGLALALEKEFLTAES